MNSPKARVTHDPADLREAAQNTRFAERAAQYKSKLADRLEAWADDLEQQQIADNNQTKDTTT